MPPECGPNRVFLLLMMLFFHLHLLGSWQKVNREPVCFGARNNNYGAFNITKSGLLKTMKLVHKSGSIKCNTNMPASYWGCTYAPLYGNNSLMTIITNAKKEAILPPAGDLIAHNDCDKNHFYGINGTTHTSPELLYRDLTNKVSVSRKQELQIWYGQDWIDCSEGNNNDEKTCVDVYAWYE